MQGSVEAFYEKYGPMVYRRCQALLRDEERALDAMQETFVRLLQNRDRLRASHPSALLLRIATNVCLNLIRGQRRKPEDPLDELVQSIAALDDPESRSLARSILGRLPLFDSESSRTMAVLHWVDGMTLEEVAREMEMSVSGVRKRLRAIQQRARIWKEPAP